MCSLKEVKMSPKKKSNKKDIKKEEVKEKPRRRLIPFTAGKLPSVSKAMPPAASAVPSVSKATPPAASAVPLVSKEIPLVSKLIPLVSAAPPHTLAKKWGLPRKEWGASKIRATRGGEPKRPKDIGLFRFLGKVFTAPYQPVEMVKGITSAVYSQAEEEKDPKVALGQELLELKMRFERGEMTEKDFKIKETKLKRQIKDIEGKEETKEVKK